MTYHTTPISDAIANPAKVIEHLREMADGQEEMAHDAYYRMQSDAGRALARVHAERAVTLRAAIALLSTLDR